MNILIKIKDDKGHNSSTILQIIDLIKQIATVTVINELDTSYITPEELKPINFDDDVIKLKHITQMIKKYDNRHNRRRNSKISKR